jgi:hypothetical protein
VAASGTSDAVAVFDRDPTSGALTQETTPAGCVSITNPLNDGLMLVRYGFGFRGPGLIAGTVADDCTRCTAEVIESFIQASWTERFARYEVDVVEA